MEIRWFVKDLWSPDLEARKIVTGNGKFPLRWLPDGPAIDDLKYGLLVPVGQLLNLPVIIT